MKKMMMVAMALIVACSLAYADKNEQKELNKERQEIRKMAKSELSAKVDKSAKKDAKRLAKEGWEVKPGALPLEKQLNRVYLMQFEYDDDNYPKYIMGEASSVGENYDAAKTAAMSLAITNLAGQIQTEVSALIENQVGNEQLAPDDAASITKSVMASKNSIAQSIGRVIPVTEVYRRTPKKTYEVLVRIAYNGDMAKQATKKAVRENLEKEGKDLQEQLDKLLGL